MVRDFGTVRQARNGKYYGRYRVGGRDHYTPRRTTRTRVKEDLAAIAASILSGTFDDDAPPARRGAATVKILFRHWFNKLENEHYSPNTIRSYRSIWRAYISPAFGERLVDDIRPADIEDFQANLLAQGRSPRYVANIVRCMSSGFSFGVDAGMAKSNPVQLRRRHVPPAPPYRRGVALTTADLARTIAAAESYWKAAIALAGWGALRVGEVAALTRADISPDGATVTVSKAVKRDEFGHLVVGPPKSSASYRSVSLPEQAASIVREHLAAETGPAPTSLLYASSNGTPLRDARFRTALHDALAACNLPRIRFHDLRHTGLTEYGRQGATLADLMRRAGHSDPKVVMIYQHSDSERDAELARKMGR